MTFHRGKVFCHSCPWHWQTVTDKYDEKYVPLMAWKSEFVWLQDEISRALIWLKTFPVFHSVHLHPFVCDRLPARFITSAKGRPLSVKATPRIQRTQTYCERLKNTLTWILSLDIKTDHAHFRRELNIKLLCWSIPRKSKVPKIQQFRKAQGHVIGKSTAYIFIHFHPIWAKILNYYGKNIEG